MVCARNVGKLVQLVLRWFEHMEEEDQSGQVLYVLPL